MPTHVYGLAKELDKESFSELTKSAVLAPTGTQPAFMRLAGKIYIYPSEAVVGDELTATAYYYKAVSDFIDTTPSIESEIPIEFQHLVIKRAEAEVLEALNRIDEKNVKIVQVQNELKQAFDKFLGKQQESTQRIKQTDKAKLQ